MCQFIFTVFLSNRLSTAVRGATDSMQLRVTFVVFVVTKPPKQPLITMPEIKHAAHAAWKVKITTTSEDIK